MKILPHKYQIKCVDHCIKNKRSALFLDMGLGKTVIILTVINYLLNRMDIRGALILAPLRVVYEVWPAEVIKWDHLSHLSVGVLHGSKKERVLKSGNNLFAINYEGFPWLYEQLQKYKRDKFPFDYIIFDESTAIKNPKTKRFKLLKKIMKAFPRRTILTGTPSPNSLEDLWSQYFLLDDGERLGKSKHWFRQNYFYPIDYNQYQWAPYPTTAKTLSKKIEDITIRLTAEDYLKMPPIINNNVEWSMTESIKKQYKKFERDYLLELQDETVTAVNAAALSTKLRQFISGFLYSEEKEYIVHQEKLDVLDEVVQSYYGEQILIAIQYRYEYEMIKARYPKIPVIFGGINPNVTRNRVHAWNTKCSPYLVVHPASIAHGVNLQKGGRILVWYSIPWSYEHYTQLRGRLYRQGQEKPVICHHLIAKNTVENKVVRALTDKKTNETSFTKNLIKLFKGD